ncbi:MAG TPA: phosphatidylserine/phosphatidylglycerophosphate/cardiolipin synthase family protein [bacterium]|nr:phosphatidylserine/phosphatidylglycerophosphate/cardiolipin synthase family protein [bacterium]HPT29383.1 phosphatidylserine/phosphatidylglycerophosphate/cardiolipin synthase family protein [bacterium]
MKYHLYTTSKKAWDAIIKDISRAQKSIYIEMYIFLDDTQESHDFIGILKHKAQLGLKVAIIADAFGSYAIKKQTVSDLRQAGVDFHFFSHFWRRTHRKIVLIDERLAYLGGVNIEKKILYWDDLQIKLGGKKTVKGVLRSFAQVYRACGGLDKNIIRYYNQSLIKKIKSLVLENLPGKSRRALGDYYRRQVISAKRSIKLITPYFIPPRWLMTLLDDAIRRNVEVKIIIPRDTDIRFINRINYYYAAKLQPLGIKFFASPKMNHAKAMIIDDEEGLIGSQNLDLLSFNWNFEIGVFFRQKKTVKDLKAIFHRWEKRSIPFPNLEIKLNILDKITAKLIRLFLSII